MHLICDRIIILSIIVHECMQQYSSAATYLYHSLCEKGCITSNILTCASGIKLCITDILPKVSLPMSNTVTAIKIMGHTI